LRGDSMQFLLRGMRYLWRQKRPAAAATTAGTALLLLVLAGTGTITPGHALLTAALGTIIAGLVTTQFMLYRLDQRTDDVRRALSGRRALLTSHEMAGVAERAKGARLRAEDLYDQGHLQEAVDEPNPYAAFDDRADHARRPMM